MLLTYIKYFADYTIEIKQSEEEKRIHTNPVTHVSRQFSLELSHRKCHLIIKPHHRLLQQTCSNAADIKLSGNRFLKIILH